MLSIKNVSEIPLKLSRVDKNANNIVAIICNNPNLIGQTTTFT